MYLWDDDLTPAVLHDCDGASITTLLRVLRFYAECWGVTTDDAWWAYGASVATLDVSRHTAVPRPVAGRSPAAVAHPMTSGPSAAVL
ncbi:hypothetical protein ABZS88_40295 [Streptomyces sp. NPDC005480]|uniref:hypothetical protein n=1 Tax=Streptomyces sp. NPDC005480 TaxID=3154880 RepID=UPI0033B24454